MITGLIVITILTLIFWLWFFNRMDALSDFTVIAILMVSLVPILNLISLVIGIFAVVSANIQKNWNGN